MSMSALKALPFNDTAIKRPEYFKGQLLPAINQKNVQNA
jgi:hypothetical protein